MTYRQQTRILEALQNLGPLPLPIIRQKIGRYNLGVEEDIYGLVSASYVRRERAGFSITNNGLRELNRRQSPHLTILI